MGFIFANPQLKKLCFARFTVRIKPILKHLRELFLQL